MKGIKRLKPSKVKYDSVWDPDIVLKTLMTLVPAHEISMYDLTVKTVMLFLLCTGRRPQTIPALNIDVMKRSKGHLRFGIDPADLKEGRFNTKGSVITLGHFSENRAICIYTYLATYLDRTEKLRPKDVKSVFITCAAPYVTPSMDTVKHWVKHVLDISGIDLDIFGAGSTRAAATSKASKSGCALKTILNSAGWKRSSTFRKYYNKDFVQPRAETMANKILTIKK
jgi:hypothetical protein